MSASSLTSTERPSLLRAFINELSGAELFFKCENLQKAGAFKARGASNAVFGLNDAQSREGCGDPFLR